MPSALVLAMMLAGLVPAPVDGEVKVTGTPITGLPLASLRITWSGAPNADPTEVDCATPLRTPMVAGAEVGQGSIVKAAAAAFGSATNRGMGSKPEAAHASKAGNAGGLAAKLR